MALFVRRYIPSFLRQAHSHFIVVEVLLAGVKVVVVSVYLPSKGKVLQNKLLKEIWNAIADDVESGTHVLLLGDFNNNRADIVKRMERIGMGLILLETNGPAETWHRKVTHPTALDHVICSPSLSSMCNDTKVLRSWDFSDHYAISTRLRVQGLVHGVIPREKSQRISPEVVCKLRKKIRECNKFGPLLELMEDYELDPPEDKVQAIGSLTEEFMKISKDSIASMIGDVKKDEKRQRRRRHANRVVKKAIEARSLEFKRVTKAAEKVRKNPDSAEAKEELKAANVKLKEVDRVTQQKIREWRSLLFDRHVAKAAKMYGVRDYRQLFGWCRTLLGGGARSSTLTSPIRGKDGSLLLEPEKILKAWWEHYTELASDVTGHSGDEEYWENNLPHLGRVQNVMDELNVPVTWHELQETLRSMSRNKAPGLSGIPVEYYLQAVESKEDLEKAEPTTSNSLGKALLFVVRGMLEHSAVPPCLRTATLVSVPKKDCDLTLMDSYRGISLMESLLKIVCTLLNRRLSAALEARSILSKDQAGFRRIEEGIAQVVALKEICGRRKVDGKPTYLAFLDLKKAYDRVPHGALFQTLRRLGVQGKALAFIKELYAVSSSRVRLPCGLSDEIKLKRGLRQGCPLSCLLYDMFADDSRYDLDGLGVTVPGITGRAAKLDFADDQVLLAESANMLKEALDRMSLWADAHEMEFGVKKCGVMVMHGPQSDLDNVVLRLQGQDVPRTTCYRYLGIMVDSEFSVDTMLMAREQRIRNATAACAPFLRCERIPISIRLTILRSCILPVATFGGEIWGFNKGHAARLQSAFDYGLKLVTLRSGRSRACASRVLYRETGIAPIEALAAAARLRLLLKAPRMKTWIFVLSHNPARQKPPQWFANGSAQAKKVEGKGVEDKSEETRIRDMKETIWTRGDKTAMKAASWSWYSGLEKTRAYIWQDVRGVRITIGVSMLLEMRTGAFQTTVRLVHAGIVKDEFRTKCPCCDENTEESVEHILVECKRWSKARKKMFRRINQARRHNKLTEILFDTHIQDGRFRFVVRLLLGGAAALDDQEDEVTLAPLWCEGSLPEGDSGAFESRRAIMNWETAPMALAVAYFLGKIAPYRSGLVFKHQTASTKNVRHHGTIAFPPTSEWSTSLGPEG